MLIIPIVELRGTGNKPKTPTFPQNSEGDIHANSSLFKKEFGSLLDKADAIQTPDSVNGTRDLTVRK